MDGIVYINKEKGMTSFDVIRKLRKIFNEKSIGHTGTLDPNAEGLLIVLLGKYTKLLPYCNHDFKEYIAQIKLGQKTDTLDIWGEVLEEKEINFLSKEDFEGILRSFKKKQLQVPPMYSAKKIKGQKLYDLARRGIEVERRPVEIEVYEANLLEYTKETIEVAFKVSSGTYIRSLVNDIALASNNLGCMSSLKRIAINKINLNQAYKLDEDIKVILDPSDILEAGIGICDYEFNDDIKNGRQIKLNFDKDTVLLKKDDKPLAIYTRVENDTFKCKRGLW